MTDRVVCTRLLAQQWAAYVELVMPTTAGVVQMRESRRAFYAGAEALLRSIMTNLDPGPEPSSDDLARMDALHAELKTFARDVAEDRA